MAPCDLAAVAREVGGDKRARGKKPIASANNKLSWGGAHR